MIANGGREIKAKGQGKGTSELPRLKSVDVDPRFRGEMGVGRSHHQAPGLTSISNHKTTTTFSLERGNPRPPTFDSLVYTYDCVV